MQKNLGGVLLIIGKKRAARRTPAPPWRDACGVRLSKRVTQVRIWANWT